MSMVHPKRRLDLIKKGCCLMFRRPTLLILAGLLLAFLVHAPTIEATAKSEQRCARFNVSEGKWTIANACEREVVFAWRDEGSCHVACRARLDPGERQVVVPPEGEYSWEVCPSGDDDHRCSAPKAASVR